MYIGRTMFVQKSFVFIMAVLFRVVTESPQFRVTAPEIICAEPTNASLGRPEYTIVSIEPEFDTDLNITWSIGWAPLKAPSQRFTLMLWNKIRALEKKLNKLSTEKTFIVKNEELLGGVTYVFNVSAISFNGGITTKTFSINCIPNQRVDKDLSVSLMGVRNTFADIDLTLEARITACEPLGDYYYMWSIYYEGTSLINVSNTIGSRLELPPHSLKPGDYEVNCQVVKEINNAVLGEVNSLFLVKYRGIKVYLNVDRLVVSLNTAFSLQALLDNYDYIGSVVEYEWQCYNDKKACNFIESSNENIYDFPSGIPYKGEFVISLTVNVFNETAKVNATLITSEANLPTLEIQPIKRVLNENEEVKIIAKVYNVAPSCNLTWYFAPGQTLKTGENTKHGATIATTQSTTTYSLGEKFLEDLIDFENETALVDLEADFLAKEGRLRLVAECVVVDEQDIAYAEINFKLNKAPTIATIMIFPSSGTAVLTIFKISAKASDEDIPLRYSFYCVVEENSTILLGSYLDHRSIDTYLPYIDGGTKILAVICDSLGACSNSDFINVQLQPNNGSTIEALIQTTKGHVKRCEILQFQRIVESAFVSYKNADQSEQAIFMRSLLETLPELRSCLSRSRYIEVLNHLAAMGLDIEVLYDKV